MMQSLRNNMKTILTVVLFAFLATIVFSWGMGGFKNNSQAEQGIIGIINGQKIQYQQFAMALEQEVAKVREQTGNEDLSDYQMQRIRDQVWQNTVRDILLAQKVEEMGISTTPEEIVFFMRNSPPEFVQQNELFQTDGRFDMQKYQEALQNPSYYEAWIPLENYFRSVLPAQKLQQWVLSTVRVSEGEVMEALRMENERANVQYVRFNPTDISLENIAVTDKEVKSYYNTNQSDFENPEQRTLQYVAWPFQATAQDSEQTRQDLNYILEELRNGADFAEMAREYSQDGSASQGGDLGFFGRGSMVKPFEDAAFNARIGEIVGPVETQFGVHVIKVTARKQEKGETQVQASHILLKFDISPDTRERIYDAAQYFSEKATESGNFTAAAAEEGFEVLETGAFQAGTFVPPLGMASRANHLAFNHDLGWISSPVRAGEQLIVFRVSDIQKASVPPLEEVSDRIRRTLERERRREKAGELSRNFAADVRNGTDFETAAKSDSLQIRETGPFSLSTTNVPGVGNDPAFIGTAFSLENGAVSDAVEGQNSWYVLRMLDHIRFAGQPDSASVARKKEELLRQKQNQFYMSWYQQLQDEADIEDFRNAFF